MSREDIKKLVLQAVDAMTKQGAGWSQESVVLREVREEISRRNQGLPIDKKTQQDILDTWHDLFAEKKLGWGYDLDNPNSPFFHLRS